MIRRTIQEWGYLPVTRDGGNQTVTRSQANRLIAAARAAQASLRLAGSEGERILVDYGKRFRAQQVVGVLAAPGISLEILPKIDGLEQDGTRINLIRMLARTLDLKIAGGALMPVGWQHRDVLEILIRLFCDKLLDAIHRGITRSYVRHEDDLPMLRGRNDVKRQFTILAASPHRVASRYDELSADTPLNQILKAAVRRLRVISRASENQRRLNELEFALADVTLLPIEQLSWRRVVLDRTNILYHDLLQLAAALLRGRYQFIGREEGVGFSLLFEMNRLFEEFIGRTLRIAMRDSGLRVTLQSPKNYALSEIGTNEPRFMTKPDIVIHCGDRCVMVIDTKWKRLAGQTDDQRRGVSQSDVYQTMAYAQIYRVKHLMLLYPHHTELGRDEGLVCDYRVTGAEEVRLSIATISLLDLDRISSRLKSLIARVGLIPQEISGST
jgi:5-methylcytosine-specific restriction enzyme subunit McrC